MLPIKVKTILDDLAAAGHEAFVVGGAVRDMALGKYPNDYDIATTAAPHEVVSIFSGLQVIPTGKAFGTMTLVLGDDSYQISTYRSDGAYSDWRRPDTVTYLSNLQEDLFRRDFTINTLIHDGKDIIDHLGAVKDLTSKTIRAVGSPHARFREDPLRMLRAIRFAAQLGFDIEPETWVVLCSLASAVQHVSQERINAELSKMLVSPRPAHAMRLLASAGLLKIIAPEIDALRGFDQRNPRHDRDVFEHTMLALAATPPDLITRLAALYHDVGKPATFSVDEKGIGHFYGHHKAGAAITEESLRRLRFPNKVVGNVSALVLEHMSCREAFRGRSVKRLIARIGVDLLENLYDLQAADIIAHCPPFDHGMKVLAEFKAEVKRVIEANEALKVTDLVINGNDLKMLSVEPGPFMGELLNQLLDDVVEGRVPNEREALLVEARGKIKMHYM